MGKDFNTFKTYDSLPKDFDVPLRPSAYSAVKAFSELMYGIRSLIFGINVPPILQHVKPFQIAWHRPERVC
jgi:hypothetical protein